MAQSKPLLALAAAQFGHDWVYNTILSHISRYEHVMLDMSTADNGLYGAIPFLVMMFVSIASGFLCDWLINTNRITVTSARIYFASAGEYNYKIETIQILHIAPSIVASHKAPSARP